MPIELTNKYITTANKLHLNRKTTSIKQQKNRIITDAEKVFKAVAKKTAGFIVVENKNSDALTADLEKLTKNRLTLKEALESTDFYLMAKQQLKRIFNDIYAQLDQIYDTENTEVLEA